MSNDVKKSALIITILTLTYKMIGFLKEMLLAYYYGTGSIVDAYIMALTIPTILFGWLSSLSVSYIPFYYEIGKKNKIKEYTNSIITITVIVSLFCIALGEVFAPWIIKICAPGYYGERFDLTVKFFRIYLFSCLFIPIYKIFVSFVKCKKAYVAATIPDLFNSFVVIMVIVASQYLGREFLAYGNLLAVIVQVILIASIAIKLGYRYKPEITQIEYIKKTALTVVPIFFSNMLVQINLFIDRIFASKLNTGSLSALNYGETIKDFVYYLGSIAVLTIIFPLISEKVSDGKMEEVTQIVKKGFNLTTVLFIPLQFGIIFFAKPLIELIFQRGMFSTNSSNMTSNSLIFYSIGLFAIVMNAISHNLYYSLKKTKWVLLTSLGNVILNVIFNLLLVRQLDYIGLALSTSIASIILLPINFYLVKRVLPSFRYRTVGIVLLKSVVASVIMVAIVVPIYYLGALESGGALIKLLLLIVIAALGGVIYIFLMKIMKSSEVEFFIDLFFKVVGKYKFKKNKI